MTSVKSTRVPLTIFGVIWWIIILFMIRFWSTTFTSYEYVTLVVTLSVPIFRFLTVKKRVVKAKDNNVKGRRRDKKQKNFFSF